MSQPWYVWLSFAAAIGASIALVLRSVRQRDSIGFSLGVAVAVVLIFVAVIGGD